ncbi:glycosyltransferase family 39 protein [Candidatus Methylocalor cossyra]|uniref:4-amino-4-deoxy-L-arabinose transferase n=1 Tax=Candidatus Methylocalor cossyra TaxID=3108543 RepID=A0ABP1C8U2_9GAMM
MAFFPEPDAGTAKAGAWDCRARQGLVLVAFGVAAWAVFAHLGDFPLLAPDEGRNAEVAREMREQGAWLVPTYNGAVYLDKPAFFFKIVALSLALLGESEIAARLPSALFGFGLLLMLYGFCRRAYGELTAALAVAIVAATPLYMAFARIVIFDMTLAFFVSGSVFLAFMAEEWEGRARALGHGAAALMGGIATLVKGPVGFVIPLLVMTVYLWSEGRGDAIKRLFAPRNGALFLAVVLPWFLGLSLVHPDFPYYGIVKESLARFATGEFHRTQPFYFYGLVIAGGGFAWSLLLPEALAAAWRARRGWLAADRLFMVWALVVVGFFSLSQSKLPGYVLTALVALGALNARVFARALEDAGSRAARIVAHGSLALALVAAAAALVALALDLEPAWIPGLRLKPPLREAFGPVLPTLAASLGGVALLAGLAYRLRNPRWALAAFLIAPLLLVTADFELLPRHAALKSGYGLAERLLPSLSPDTELACLNCLPNGVPFYLKRLVTVISDQGKEFTSNYLQFSLARGGPRPERLVPAAELSRWLASRDHPTLLLGRSDQRPRLAEIAARYRAELRELGYGYWAVPLPPTAR